MARRSRGHGHEQQERSSLARPWTGSAAQRESRCSTAFAVQPHASWAMPWSRLRKCARRLLEELGRFQEFRPVLVELENQSEIGQESPTLAALNEAACHTFGKSPPMQKGACLARRRASLGTIRDEFDGAGP